MFGFDTIAQALRNVRDTIELTERLHVMEAQHAGNPDGLLASAAQVVQASVDKHEREAAKHDAGKTTSLTPRIA